MKTLFTFIFAIASITAMAQNETKNYTNSMEVSVGAMWKYATEADVTYSVHTYQNDGQTTMDVTIPAYVLKGTAVGDLNIGSYTVTGLTFDAEKDGYYRNYANDGLSLEFSSSGSIAAGTYVLSAGENGNNIQEILVKTDANGSVTSIVNQFKVGKMPFQLISTFSYDAATAISTMNADNNNDKMYDLSGSVTNKQKKGKIYIKGGKKILR